MAETGDIAMGAGDVAAALAVVEAEVPTATDNTAHGIIVARAELARRRARLEAMPRAVEEAKRIADRGANLNSEEFRGLKSSAAEAITAGESMLASAKLELDQATRAIEIEQEADQLAASLAEVLEHGARIGLNHGRCPLCDAFRTGTEFEAGLARARERLNALGSGVNAARIRMNAAEERSANAEVQLRQAESQLAG